MIKYLLNIQYILKTLAIYLVKSANIFVEWLCTHTMKRMMYIKCSIKGLPCSPASWATSTQLSVFLSYFLLAPFLKYGQRCSHGLTLLSVRKVEVGLKNISHWLALANLFFLLNCQNIFIVQLTVFNIKPVFLVDKHIFSS